MNEPGVVNFRGTMQASEGFIRTVINSYMLAASLFSMVSFDLFTHIEQGGSLSPVELAARCGLPLGQVNKLVSVARAIGLMTLTDGRLSLSVNASNLLSRTSANHLCDAIMHHKNHIYPLFGHLDDSLRSCAPVLAYLGWPGSRAEFFEHASEQETELAIAVAAMNTFSRGAGERIASLITADRPRATLLDLGGGGGKVAIDIAHAMPQARITLFDRSSVVAHARAAVEEQGLQDRIDLVSGDAFSPLPFKEQRFDVVVIASVLGDYARHEQELLLAGAHRCLKTDGLLIISETLLDDDRGGPILPALMSLYAQVLTPGGDNFTASSIRELLLASGFADVQVHSNRQWQCRDSITALKA